MESVTQGLLQKPGSPLMLDLRETLSGVLGACCAVYAGLPFEVVKVRLQTQSRTNAYKGVTDAFRRIVTEEGMAALWKGAVPALSSSSIENSVLFSANGLAKQAVVAMHAKERTEADGNDVFTIWDEACMGACAGCFSATVGWVYDAEDDHVVGSKRVLSCRAITIPENIKCKLQFQRGHLGEGRFHGPVDCFLQVSKDEGMRGLWRGYSALLLRDVPFTFCFFGVYKATTSRAALFCGKDSKNELHPLTILGCGGLAGACSWGLMFPLDVLKSRIQTAPSSQPLSLPRACRAVYLDFGIRGFYRGWTAAVLRAFPANGSLFLGVEMTHRLFRWLEDRNV
ncbi:hypothetical protein PsorP6_000901 [Peronosclerospora sorghi]|uniref:Uncharacterized protein n=1 Tax=Peronosclerospora sorghi TaxID=230839 RepID=A0ACC0WQ43_9STRA|nr:hypothetical protein PsorP6_000901 [Peronosclerospora sorghi]